MSQPDLFTEEGFGVTHAVLPDFSLACGIGYLEKPAGDRVTFSANRWHQVTCVWCHSLGAAWYRHAVALQQGRAA